MPPIIEICTEFIKYDPNYAYDDVTLDDDETMEVDDDEEEDGDGESEDMDEYSDDDDISWKARRSAAKCIETLITSRSDRLGEHYATLAPLLLDRFKERDQSVKIDVFRAYEALLKQTRLFLPDRLANLDSVIYQPQVSSIKLRVSKR